MEQRKAKQIAVGYETHWNLDRVAVDILTEVEHGRPVCWARVNCKRTIKTLIFKLTCPTWAKAHGFARPLRPHQIAKLTADNRHESAAAKAIIETGKTPDYVRVVLATQLVDSGLSILDTAAAVFWVDTDPHHPPTPQTLVQYANRYRKMERVNIRAFFHDTAGTFADGMARPRGTDDPDELNVNYYKREAGRNWHLNNEAEAQGFKDGATSDADAADLRNGITSQAFGRFDGDGHTRPIEALRVANEHHARRLTLPAFMEACGDLDARISFEWTDGDWIPDTDDEGNPLPDLQADAVAAIQKHGRAALYELAANLTHLQTLAAYARHVWRRRGRWCGFYTDGRRKPDGLDERIGELVTMLRGLFAALPEVINADAVADVKAMTAADVFSLCKLKEVLDRIGYLRGEMGATHAVAVAVAADNAGAAKWGEFLAAFTLGAAQEYGPQGVSKRIGRRLDAATLLTACEALTQFEGRAVRLSEILEALEAVGLYGWTEKRMGSLIGARYADADKKRVRLPDGGQTTVWTFAEVAALADAARRYFGDEAEKVAAHVARRAACAAFGNTVTLNSQTLHTTPEPPPPNPDPLPDWCIYVDELKARGEIRGFARRE